MTAEPILLAREAGGNGPPPPVAVAPTGEPPRFVWLFLSSTDGERLRLRLDVPAAAALRDQLNAMDLSHRP